MSLTIIILIAISIYVFASKKENRWIKYGKFRRSRHLTIGQHSYYIEEVVFRDFHQAIHHYFKIIADLEAYADAIEVKYDYNDWSNTVFRFQNTTIKLVRRINKVYLIKSAHPISIDDFEWDYPKIGT